MAIPKDFVAEYSEKAKGAMFFGESVEALSREEFLACVASLLDEIARIRGENRHEREVWLGLVRAARRG